MYQSHYNNKHYLIKAKVFILLALAFCNANAFQNSTKQQEQNSQVTFKVLSFNILHGATTKGDFNLDAIAKVIIEVNPDFVALQEVDYKTNRAKGFDLATEMGYRTKMTSIFGRTFYFDGGEFGEALLSKHTFISSRTIPLPYKHGAPHIILEVTTVLPSNDTIVFGGTHLDYKPSNIDRVLQANTISQVIPQSKYPTILAGDFNDIPGSEAINIIENIMGHSYNKNNIQSTWPSHKPEKKIDYVFFYPKKKTWKVLETRVIQDSIASDHCAYLSTIRYNKIK